MIRPDPIIELIVFWGSRQRLDAIAPSRAHVSWKIRWRFNIALYVTRLRMSRVSRHSNFPSFHAPSKRDMDTLMSVIGTWVYN